MGSYRPRDPWWVPLELRVWVNYVDCLERKDDCQDRLHQPTDPGLSISADDCGVPLLVSYSQMLNIRSRWFRNLSIRGSHSIRSSREFPVARMSTEKSYLSHLERTEQAPRDAGTYTVILRKIERVNPKIKTFRLEVENKEQSIEVCFLSVHSPVSLKLCDFVWNTDLFGSVCCTCPTAQASVTIK